MATPHADPLPIPQSHRDLIDRPIVAALAVVLPDGTPQVTPVWLDYHDGYLRINSAAGRLKDRAMRERPHVALTIVDPENPYRYLAIRGPVVEITEQNARQHINDLSQRYTGNPDYKLPEGQVRVLYRIAPERVSVFG